MAGRKSDFTLTKLDDLFTTQAQRDEEQLSKIRDIPSGTKGTVKEVDDTGTIHVHWDNGCCLGVVYGEDSCRKLNTVKVICYNDEEVWDSREDALEFYMKAMAGSEGSEQERYAKIVAELAMGKDVCTDGEE